MSARRVLYLHPHFTLPGGAGRHALETGKELASRGWDVHIASIRHSTPLIADYKTITFHELGGPLSSSLLFWLRLPLLLMRVCRLIETLKPDIVFSQVFPANWWGFFAKATMGDTINHVWMCQEPSAFIHSRKWIQALPYSAAGIGARILNPILKVIDRRLARHVDAVFANSCFSKSLAIKAYRYGNSRVEICYPGVDTTRFHPSSETSYKNRQFVTCARLTRFKNIDKIIQAVADMRGSDISVVIIGDGEEYERLLDIARTRLVSDSIIFKKNVSDSEMVKTLQESVALIHAAEEEPFGLAPVEAMACGTPVIAIRGGGPAETIIHGETGYLCEAATSAELQIAINTVLEQKERGALGQLLCVERAKQFSWRSATDSLENIFDSLLHTNRRKAS